jgi:3-deoxy-D-manno-octulosonic-acid transferase
MENFRDVARLLTASNGALQCAAEDLPEQLGLLLEDKARCHALGERGKETIAANAGAIERTIGLLEPYLVRTNA